MNFAEFITSAGGVASSVTAIIGLIVMVIWKPVIKKRLDLRKEATCKKEKEDSEFRSSMLSFVSSTASKMQQIEDSIDANEKDRIRYEVLDFANSCRNKRRHTKDEFEHIIVLNEKYHRLLRKTNDENGVFNAEYNYVYELYQKCQRENDFL